MQRTVFTTRDIWSNPRSRPRTSIGLRTAGLEDLNNRKLLVEGDDGKPGVAYLRPENHRPAFVDGTMYFGDRDNDDVMIRVMDKVRDVQNREKGTYKIISETEKRVRR